jgi:general stress protein 26
MNDEIVQAAINLVKSSSNVLVGSTDKEGYPYIKNMFNARVRNGLKVFYFTTNTSSLRVAHFLNNPKACLYYVDDKKFHGLMIRGSMEVLQDKASKELIWREGDTKYYPLGVNDPDYCVFKFTGESCRFYTNLKSTNFMIE